VYALKFKKVNILFTSQNNNFASWLEAWSFTFRKEHNLQGYQNKVLRRINDYKRDKVNEQFVVT